MELNVRDSVKAIVSCCTSKGVYLELENGESAYAIFNRLPRGTHVYCIKDGFRSVVDIGGYRLGGI